MRAGLRADQARAVGICRIVSSRTSTSTLPASSQIVTSNCAVPFAPASR